MLERYEYDSGTNANLQGRLARVSGDFGSVEYGYTAEGLASRILRTVNGVPGTFETRFEYNGKRQVTRVVYPDGSSVDYNHSPSGMLQSIPGYIDAIDYGPTGLRERIRFANGLETRRRYTQGDYLTNEVSTEQAGGGHRYQHLIYELDAVGQALRIDDLSTVPGKVRLNQVYTYDARDRLTRASGSVGGVDFTYEYDVLGNLLLNDEIGTRFEYRNGLGDSSGPNQLVRRLSSANPEYQYDGAGV